MVAVWGDNGKVGGNGGGDCCMVTIETMVVTVALVIRRVSGTW
jgi:hypothetical protein